MTTPETKLRRLAAAGRAMLTALRAGPAEYEQAVDHEYNDLLAGVMEAELAERDDARIERGTRSVQRVDGRAERTLTVSPPPMAAGAPPEKTAQPPIAQEPLVASDGSGRSGVGGDPKLVITSSPAGTRLRSAMEAARDDAPLFTLRANARNPFAASNG